MTALDYLNRIEQALTVPAAEYVPAIGDAFAIIDEARRALESSQRAPQAAGLTEEQIKNAKRYEWLRDESNGAPDNTPTVYSHRIIKSGRLLHGRDLDAAVDAAIERAAIDQQGKGE